MNCAFCETKNLEERVISENALAKAFPTTQPIVPGHILIIPKRCVSTFEELTNEEKDAIFTLMNQIKESLKKTFNSKGFNHAWNEEILAGQTVPHFHLHVIPRKENDEGIYEYEPRKFLYRPNSRSNSPQKELVAVANLIRANI